MFYRRKLLLAFLQHFEDGLEKIKLQKLLFLFSHGQQHASYHFVPYKFGCYSFQANADLGTMVKYQMLTEDGKKWQKVDPTNYFELLNPADKKRLSAIIKHFGHLSPNQLIEYTYKKFPFFAINSQIASEILPKQDFEKVLAARPVSNNIKLFTIGYEGVSLETYINKLIKNDIKLLCDVRRNPLSMKYGFSKTQLQNACNGVGINYIHIPEVGIDSESRQSLNAQLDYDQLFKKYEEISLPANIDQQIKILNLLKKHQRIALTCFEANICQCHRKPLAESITRLDGFSYSLQHI